MAQITAGQIEQINQIYYECKNKAETARRVGVSVYAVNKYLVPRWKPASEIVVQKFTHDMLPELDISKIDVLPIEQWYKYCVLSSEELGAIKDLQKEVQI